MPARCGALLTLTVACTGFVLGCASPAREELDAARRELGRGRYRESIERYTEVTLQAPGSPEAAEALYGLALIQYLKLRDLDAARSNFRKLLALFPDNSVGRQARLLLARIYQEDLGDPARAIQEYELLLKGETDPLERKSLLLRIASCRYSLDQLEQAAARYRHVVEDLPYDEEGDVAYLRLATIERLGGRAEEALTWLERLLRVSKQPESRRRALLGQAEVLAELGRLSEAQARLTLAEQEFPGDPEAASLGERLRQQEEDLKLLDEEATRSRDLEKRIRWSRRARR